MATAISPAPACAFPLNPRILSALDGIVALLHHTGIETVMITGKQSAATQAIGLQLV